MKLNWFPDKVAFLDFETMSTADLPSIGAKKYAADPSTKVACASMKVDGEYIPFDKEKYASIAETHTLVAHNAPFDAEIWDRFVGAPAKWFDTLMTSRASGLPGGLDKLGQLLCGRGKDPVGKRLIDMISKVKIKNGEPQYVTGTSHLWRQFEEYCRRDVELLEIVYNKTKQNVEPEIMTVDRAINDRGIPVFTPLLKHLSHLSEFNTRKSASEFDESVGINPRSPKQVMEWLKKRGFHVDTVNKLELIKLVTNPEEFFVGEEDCESVVAEIRVALEQRSELVRVGSSKINTALNLEFGGRLFDQHVYWGAHTGRWTARGFQPQNLPSRTEAIDVHKLLTTECLDYCTVARVAADATAKMRETDPTAYCPAGLVINSLVRPCIRTDGMLSIVDFGAVEARGVAWVADEQKMLKVFQDPKRDLYLEYAIEMYGKHVKKEDFERFVAKQIILACGYGLSGPGFKRSFDKFLYIVSTKMHGTAIDEEDAKKFVQKYRQTFWKIPSVWKAYQTAMMACVSGSSMHVGKCDFYLEHGAMVVRLPSGRCLRYNNVRVEDRVPGWARLSNNPVRVPTVVYANPKGYDDFLYGGKITENIVQAICRDLLAWSMVELEREELRPCVHVHDEVVCETDNINKVCEIMSSPPSWASGFPILVEGLCAPYWTKQPGYFKPVKALNGRVS